jgi:hypothetical protein
LAPEIGESIPSVATRRTAQFKKMKSEQSQLRENGQTNLSSEPRTHPLSSSSELTGL